MKVFIIDDEQSIAAMEAIDCRANDARCRPSSPDVLEPPQIAQPSSPSNSIAANETLPTLVHVELNYLKVVLDAVKENKTQAANVMGVDRKTLYRMVERLASTYLN